MTEEKKLNERHKLFCEEYIKDYNGTRSYLEVYPDSSYDAAKSSAYDLLTNPYIKAYLEELKKRTAELAGVSPLMIASELKKLAFSSIARLRTDWITRAEYDSISDDDKDAIQEIDTKILQRNIGTSEEPDIVDVEYVKIKLFDKVRAIQELKKMFGYDAPDKVEHSGTGITIQTTTSEQSKKLQELEDKLKKVNEAD